ncbi:MAG: hypothetical protein A3B14_02470 [Candidatus Zambryskibacteria bacterium RIFCSPLOWO2_01_FULL_45_21]|uniref:Uncharacterized protein n=1 Tax=Candidatus Zambryskibacteria bacterium RIFCSPLOWO2_01_FULL_45_21 TaxID=1802761 RepID=A0A1G2U2Y6_9BACT|nr:MAG: hypothetical protein A3B14_02470 [Candidatus Zambryskibacteria bacterium RIFCSPLOWO2_01_FULL_45_21]
MVDEFDRTNYPEWLSCKAMPAVNDESIEVEVTDFKDNTSVVEVPAPAYKSFNMPRFPAEMPAPAHELYNQSIGLGMVACRVVDRNDKVGLLEIELPTIPEPTAMTIATSKLARRV